MSDEKHLEDLYLFEILEVIKNYTPKDERELKKQIDNLRASIQRLAEKFIELGGVNNPISGNYMKLESRAEGENQLIKDINLAIDDACVKKLNEIGVSREGFNDIFGLLSLIEDESKGKDFRDKINQDALKYWQTYDFSNLSEKNKVGTKLVIDDDMSNNIGIISDQEISKTAWELMANGCYLEMEESLDNYSISDIEAIVNGAGLYDDFDRNQNIYYNKFISIFSDSEFYKDMTAISFERSFKNINRLIDDEKKQKLFDVFEENFLSFMKDDIAESVSMILGFKKEIGASGFNFSSEFKFRFNEILMEYALENLNKNNWFKDCELRAGLEGNIDRKYLDLIYFNKIVKKDNPYNELAVFLDGSETHGNSFYEFLKEFDNHEQASEKYCKENYSGVFETHVVKKSNFVYDCFDGKDTFDEEILKYEKELEINNTQWLEKIRGDNEKRGREHPFFNLEKDPLDKEFDKAQGENLTSDENISKKQNADKGKDITE